MAEQKVYSGKKGEELGRELQKKLKQQANETVNSNGFQPLDSEDDQSTVSMRR